MRHLALIALLTTSAVAGPRPIPQKPWCTLPGQTNCRKPADKIIDITDPLSVDGRVRVFSLLGFIERANEELERSSLEKKSFVPKIVQSVDDEQL